MIRLIFIFSCISTLTVLQGCKGCSSDQPKQNVEISDEVKEKENVESYIQKKIQQNSANDKSTTDVEDSLKAKEIEATIEAINQSEFKSYTCQAFLDTLAAGIKHYRNTGELDVLYTYEKFANDHGLNACLEEKGAAFTEQYNILVDSVYAIRDEL